LAIHSAGTKMVGKLSQFYIWQKYIFGFEDHCMIEVIEVH
jgi:hypothetical protein